jgi:hypothetical protein
VTAKTPPKTSSQQRSGTKPTTDAAAPAGAHPTAFTAVKESFFSRLLDPIDLLVEGIYSVLIVLTFTLAARAVHTQGGKLVLEDWDTVVQLFLAAAGCALAWGLIDGAMYVLTCAFERGKDRRLYRLTQNAPSEEAGVALLSDELDDELGALASEAERRQIYVALYQRLRLAPPPRPGFKQEDFGGGLGTFLVAAGAAIPVLLPLLLMPGSVSLRVRASNLVAFAMLFAMGYRWGQYAGGKPFIYGLLLLILGVTMVLVAIPLGG